MIFARSKSVDCGVYNVGSGTARRSSLLLSSPLSSFSELCKASPFLLGDQPPSQGMLPACGPTLRRIPRTVSGEAHREKWEEERREETSERREEKHLEGRDERPMRQRGERSILEDANQKTFRKNGAKGERES